MRQHCLSYITNSLNKIVDNFEELQKQFSEVTAMLKVSNHMLFLKDMSRHLADLELTMSLLKEEGWLDKQADPSELYSGFDFSKENVPERDSAQVMKDMEETEEILAAIDKELEKEETKKVLEDLKRRRNLQKRMRVRDRADTYPQDAASRGDRESSFVSYLPVSPDLGARSDHHRLTWLLKSGETTLHQFADTLSLSSSSGSSEYEPQRVMTHLVHKFERRLRTIDELCPKAFNIAMNKLVDIHKFFCRSELALEMEREELLLLNPRSSLLSIGRVPVLNMLQDYAPQPQAPPPPYETASRYQSRYRPSLPSLSSTLHQTTSYQVSSRNTWGMPDQLAGQLVVCAGHEKTTFNTSFMDDKLGLKSSSLYVDSTYSSARWHNSESFTADPPEYEETDAFSNSLCAHSDSENLLSVRTDEDDRASGDSTNFATPETGLTPKSSDEEEEGRLKFRNTLTPQEAFRSRSPLQRGVVSNNHTPNVSGGGPHLLGVARLGVGSQCNSLEQSGDSGTLIQSESGSQCTLTDPGATPTPRHKDTDATPTPRHKDTDATPTLGHEDTDATPTLRHKELDATPTQESGATPTIRHEPATQLQSTQVQVTNFDLTGPVEPDSNARHTGTGSVDYSLQNGVEDSEETVQKQHPNGLDSTDGPVQHHPPTSLTNGVTSRTEQSTDRPLATPQDMGSTDGPTSKPLPPPQGVDSTDGAMMSTSKYPPVPPHILSINTEWQGQQEIVTFDPSSNGTTPPKHTGVKGGSHTAPVPVTRRTEIANSEESFSAGSGCYDDNMLEHGMASTLDSDPTVGVAVGVALEQAKKQRARTNSPLVSLLAAPGTPVGSIGTTSTTSDELPAAGGVVKTEERRGKKGAGPATSWANRKKAKESVHPPTDLLLRRGQGSPDVYHTPITSFPSATTTGPRFLSSKFSSVSPSSSSSPSAREDLPNPSGGGGGVGGGYPTSFSTPMSPGQYSFSSLDTVFTQTDSSILRSPLLETPGVHGLPLVSTVEHIESLSKFKPGKGVSSFCKNTPIVTDLLYCLLQGRPLVLLGKPAEENLIRRLIRVLWLFVPGHSSQRQVIIWQETPLDIRDLSRVKLIGLCNRGSTPIGAHLKPYVSCWDCSSGKLSTPSYNGELLKSIVSRTKDKKTEEVFLTHIHSVLLEIAMKAFVYYHGYCTLMSSSKKTYGNEASPRMCHNVETKAMMKKRNMAFLQKLGVRNSDIDIIEYFVDVIREQQLIKWGQEHSSGGPFNEDPVRIHLATKQCSESLCKPKRPY